MLEKIREGSQGIWAIVILGLVILSFVFAGVGGYMTTGGPTAAATVNGDEIALETLERAYQNEKARMESQFGEAFAALSADADYLAQLRQGILDRLIGDKLLEQQAAELGLRVSDAQVKAAIVAMQEFQVAGVFNNDRYLALLRQAGFQPNEFRDYMRTDMTRQQVTSALLGSEFSTENEANQAYSLQQQTRDFDYVTVPSELFSADVVVSDEEANAFYQTNLDRFDTEQKVKVAYVQLNSTDLEAGMTVTDSEVAEYYQQNIASFGAEEERRASHILIEFGEDEAAAEDKVNALLERVNAGEAFDALAEAESADTFSAENGGDLDWFTKGVMDPAFEDAAFALASIGDVSGVVKSEFGFHIIKLTDIKPAQSKPLEEVSSEIESQLLADKASERFYELQQTMAELAFEVPETLLDVADALNVSVTETELFSRSNAPIALNFPQVLSQVFSEDFIADQINSEVIELGEGQAMVVRVVAEEPARTKAFDEVKQDIVSELSQDKSSQAALAWAESQASSLQQGENVDALLTEKSLEWTQVEKQQRFAAEVDRAILEQAFSLSMAENEQTAAVALVNGDAALVSLKGIHQAEEASSEQLASLQQRLASSRSNAVVAAMVQSLKDKADVSIN